MFSLAGVASLAQIGRDVAEGVLVVGGATGVTLNGQRGGGGAAGVRADLVLDEIDLLELAARVMAAARIEAQIADESAPPTDRNAREAAGVHLVEAESRLRRVIRLEKLAGGIQGGSRVRLVVSCASSSGIGDMLRPTDAGVHGH